MAEAPDCVGIVVDIGDGAVCLDLWNALSCPVIADNPDNPVFGFAVNKSRILLPATPADCTSRIEWDAPLPLID
jgi:hypothetical protein